MTSSCRHTANIQNMQVMVSVMTPTWSWTTCLRHRCPDQVPNCQGWNRRPLTRRFHGSISSMAPNVLEKFKEAARSEEASWKLWQSVIPLDDKQAKEILQDPIQKKRVLRSRSAFRDKSKGIPPLKAKCRVVALGHLDPDLFSLSRECATPSRQAEYLLLCIFVSGRNQLAFDQSSTWSLWSGDVKTAFLQGTPQERSQPLYLL